MNLVEFFDSPLRNTWIREGIYDIYVRKGRRVLGGMPYAKCFDFATVDAAVCGTGQFGSLLQYCKDQAKMYGHGVMYIELVHNERLAAYLRRDGWQEDDRCYPPSFYQVLE